MPATSFTLVRRFEWPPRPAPVPVPVPPPVVRAPAPAPPPKKLSKKARRAAAKKARRAFRFRPAHLTVLTDRLEAALASGPIDLHDDWDATGGVQITAGELIQLLAALLPEAFSARPAPAAPLTSAPGSPRRVEEYAARHAAGAGLYHPADATLADGKVRTAPRKNGTGPEVLGWEWEAAVEAAWKLARRAAKRGG